CTCKTHHNRGHWQRCQVQVPGEVRCRKVWKSETVCEQVPCTRTVKETVCEQVPYTVCKKVPYTVTKQVPYTVRKLVAQTVTKQVPYWVCRMVQETCKKQVPYTVSRRVCGAYVDCNGGTFDCEGPGRHFQEGASVCTTCMTTTCRMVPQTRTKKVTYT